MSLADGFSFLKGPSPEPHPGSLSRRPSMMAMRCLMMLSCGLFLPGMAFADMMERPWFGPADSYWAAYTLGLVLLALVTLLTGFILRALKRKRSQRFLLCGAVLVAIIGGLALRKDYQMSRAESCFYFMQRAIRRGDRHAAMHGYGRGAVSASIHPGGAWSTFGTPPEIVDFSAESIRAGSQGLSSACGTLSSIANSQAKRTCQKSRICPFLNCFLTTIDREAGEMGRLCSLYMTPLLSNAHPSKPSCYSLTSL